MSDQPSWSVPGGPPPPPPTGAPYDVAPPTAPAWVPGPSAPGPTGPTGPAGPAGPGGPGRRGRLVLAAAATLVVLLGAGAGVVVARSHGNAAPTAAVTVPPTSASSGSDAPSAPSTTTAPDAAVTPATTPDAPGTSPVGSEFAPAPSAPDPATVRIGTGSIGAALTARGYECVAKHANPAIVGCYSFGDTYSSVEWIGTSEKPVSLAVVVQGSTDEAVALQRSLPASAGMTGSAVDAAVTAARGAASHESASGSVQVRVTETPDAPGGPRTIIDLHRKDGDRTVFDFRRTALPAGFAEAEKAATDHRYTCRRGTDAQGPSSTCQDGDRTIELFGDRSDGLVSAIATTPEAIDDLLRLFTEVGGDFERPNSQTIVGLVASVQGRRVGAAAAGGYDVLCFGVSRDRTCSVESVDW